MRAWKSGGGERSSPFRPKQETVEALPASVRAMCQRIVVRSSPGWPSWRVADQLAAKIPNGDLDAPCLASGLTPLEALAALTVYALDLAKQKSPG